MRSLCCTFTCTVSSILARRFERQLPLHCCWVPADRTPEGLCILTIGLAGKDAHDRLPFAPGILRIASSSRGTSGPSPRTLANHRSALSTVSVTRGTSCEGAAGFTAFTRKVTEQERRRPMAIVITSLFRFLAFSLGVREHRHLLMQAGYHSQPTARLHEFSTLPSSYLRRSVSFDSILACHFPIRHE